MSPAPHPSVLRWWLALPLALLAGCGGGGVRIAVVQQATDRPVAGAQICHEGKIIATTDAEGLVRLHPPRDGVVVAILATDHIPGQVTIADGDAPHTVALKPLWLDDFLRRPELQGAAEAMRGCPTCPR